MLLEGQPVNLNSCRTPWPTKSGLGTDMSVFQVTLVLQSDATIPTDRRDTQNRIHTVAGGHLNVYHHPRAVLDQACKRSDTQNGTENDHEVVFNF